MQDAVSSQPPSDPDAVAEHLVRFEAWFRQKQKSAGLDGSPLTSPEHAILRSYIAWLHEVGGADAQDKAR